MASQQPGHTPPHSRASSSCSKDCSLPLSLDLSNLPSLVQPSPPSNTILVTNLQDLAIFTAPILAHLRELISQHSLDGIHSFSPFRAMSRIIISFPSVESAVTIRSMLDGSALFGHRVRVYFGEPTPIDPAPDRHLQAPRAEKQFFISPPPSPPHGWESRDEEPPNKDVHADDLVHALERLSARKQNVDDQWGDISSPPVNAIRSRSSTIVFRPQEHGRSPDLPAIAVDDFTDEPEDEQKLHEKLQSVRPMIHTARPPVELM